MDTVEPIETRLVREIHKAISKTPQELNTFLGTNAWNQLCATHWFKGESGSACHGTLIFHDKSLPADEIKVTPRN